ncbi:MAG TPA: hypothetical protein VFM54_20280 [Micromonosporaceae bacterium]|nr:hypothetical protein [Micromonosporaceae bacterium]
MTDELAALLVDLDEAERAVRAYGPDKPDPNRRSDLSLWAEQWIRDHHSDQQ